jgi:protein-S-isoprenylcysteine O-methyltransferase Ste14
MPAEPPMLVARPQELVRARQRRTEQAVAASSEILQKARYVPDRMARHRIKITAAVFVLVIATEVILGWQPHHPLDFQNLWVAFGSSAVVIGLLIRSWAAGTLVKKKKLACDGPYSLVRHPLYLGSTLMMIGFTLLTGLSGNVAVAVFTALVCFGHAIRNEEAFLAAKFGDRWDAYAALAGRVIPYRCAGNLLAPWALNRWLRNREYNAWIGTLCGWLGLLLWST